MFRYANTPKFCVFLLPLRFCPTHAKYVVLLQLNLGGGSNALLVTPVRRKQIIAPFCLRKISLNTAGRLMIRWIPLFDQNGVPTLLCTVTVATTPV